MKVYLDNSATTRQSDQVTELMIQHMKEDFGNASSLHKLGFTAEKSIKLARGQVNKLLDEQFGEIVFTSGGTEADNQALLGIAQVRKKLGNKIIVSQIEHPAVLETCKRLETIGFKIEYLPVSKEGFLNLKALESSLDEDTILVSIMTVNNEVGTVQPINEICQMVRTIKKASGKGVLVHTDGVQAKTTQDFQALGHADLVTISGHKIYGPKGIGALCFKKGISVPAILYGGGQENNLRSGTENVPAIAGFGLAAEHLKKDIRKSNQNYLKSYLWQGISTELQDVNLNGVEEYQNPVLSSPYILNISFLGTRGEVLLHTLEQDEIYVSTGSACSSHKKSRSHVLKAMGKSDGEIEGAIRFSFGHENTVQEMDFVIEKVKNAVKRFRKLGSFR